MIDSILDAALRRPLSVVVATVALCALGLFSLARLPLSLLPAVERPHLLIVAKANAASREEMSLQVAAPIERRLTSLSGIVSIESKSVEGETRIEIGSSWQTDPDRLRIDVARRIEGVARLPLDELVIETAGVDVSPVIEVAVMGGSGSVRTRIAERVVLPELARSEGAGKIEIVGATPMRVTVEPRAASLVARNLTAFDIQERLESAGAETGAGRARDGSTLLPVVIAQPLRSPADVRNLLVKGVPLGEVAEVSLREVADATAFRTMEGQGILLRIHRAPGANAVALARSVEERVAELSPRLRGVRVVVVNDHSREVKRALEELVLAALAGVLLGTLVLRFMLGLWRPTFALVVVVPAALMASFSAFYFAGIQLDIISLAGLALAAGLLVDNSIVVLESVESARAAGRRDAVAAGTKQILRAVVASSVTLMIVFAPLLYLRGLARALFGEQAIAIIASITASLFLSLTLTPALARKDARGVHGRSPGRAVYLRMLDRVIARPLPTIAFGLIAVIGSLSLGLLLPRELFARGGERQLVMEARIPPGLDDEAARALGKRIWESIPGARSMVQQGSLVTLELAGDAPQRIDVPGVRATVRRKPSAFIEAVSGDARRIELVASAASETEASALATRVSAEMIAHGYRPVDDRDVDDLRGNAAMFVRWEPRAIGDQRSLERELIAGLGGVDVGRTDIDRAESAIRLLPITPHDLRLLPVRFGDRVVPLSAVGGARMATRVPVAYRDHGRPARHLLFERGSVAAHEPLPAFVPRGTESIRVAGQAREMSDAFEQMRLAFLVAAMLLYLTIAAFYESLLIPLVVMMSLPFAVGGAFVSLLLTRQSLNVMSLIGLVFLGGVVVNHAVVLIDRSEQLRRKGVAIGEAVRRAAADRYRPVIMTSVTAILSMLPLAILGGPGVELRRAIAVAVTGGLVTATIGTLLFVPLLLELGHRIAAVRLVPVPRHARTDDESGKGHA